MDRHQRALHRATRVRLCPRGPARPPIILVVLDDRYIHVYVCVCINIYIYIYIYTYIHTSISISLSLYIYIKHIYIYIYRERDIYVYMGAPPGRRAGRPAGRRGRPGTCEDSFVKKDFCSTQMHFLSTKGTFAVTPLALTPFVRFREEIRLENGSSTVLVLVLALALVLLLLIIITEAPGLRTADAPSRPLESPT